MTKIKINKLNVCFFEPWMQNPHYGWMFEFRKMASKNCTQWYAIV